nr:hypothetical protein [Clostridium muellerianum]
MLITQETSKVSESVQATIFLEYKSMILVRYTKPASVQRYVISVHHTAFGIS